MRSHLIRSAILGLFSAGCSRAPAPPPANRAPVPPGSRTDAASAAAVDAGTSSTEPETRLVAFGGAGSLRAWIEARRESSDGARRGAQPPSASAGSGLGTSGTGLGGGGTGQGTVGLGNVGSMGHGAGTGSGQGRGVSAPGGLASGSSSQAPSDSITNNQVQGVDEGDIVKTHGDQLVILRRGRLFSVRAGAGALTPISVSNAHGPGRPPGAWYDEMLIDGDTIVVIGFSYASRSSEVGLFDIDATGHIRWRDTLYVRSNDYYSARNYASRLVGHHLVMYAPIPLREVAAGELSVPAVRRRHDAAWQSVIDYARLFRPVQPVRWNPIVHTVIDCDLTVRTMPCTAQGVVGPSSRNFYVSGSAVYLWVNAAQTFGRRRTLDEPSQSVVFRFPLGAGNVGALRVRGTPIDQFSFDERGEALRVVVTSERSGGDAMWSVQGAGGDLGLARLPIARFTSDVLSADRSMYRGLPAVSESTDHGEMHNRFVGEYLLYGEEGPWQHPDAPRAGPHPERAVQVFDLAHDSATRLTVTHAIERLEPLGRDALAVGSAGSNLTFTAVALDATPTLAGQYTLRNASQGETRSHGFFFLPSGDRAGMLGLPVTAGQDSGTWSDLTRVSSSVQFLSVSALRFGNLGQLRSGRAAGIDDHCVASCADWYGNSRPIFWGGRTFALLGYELVEATLTGGHLRETRRVDFLRALAGNGRQNVFDDLPE